MFVLFWTTNSFTDDNGEPCTLDEHLASLRQWGGTPDMWQAFEDGTEAVQAALSLAPTEILMTDGEYNPIMTLNKELTS